MRMWPMDSSTFSSCRLSDLVDEDGEEGEEDDEAMFWMIMWLFLL